MIAKRLLATHKASYGSGGGGIVISSTDVYYDYRSLILNMQGAAGSTTFTDSSPNNFTITAYGNAQLASDATFGTVASFDGNGDSLTTLSNAAFAFGTSDFTIEGWFYSFDTGSSLRSMFDSRSTVSGSGIMIRENSSGFLVYGNGATILSVASGRTPNTWQHIAVVRSGTSLTLYINGVSAATATNSTNFTQNYCRVSGFVDTQASPYAYNGLIGPVRISPWAVYKSNFTPSQDLFPAAPDSIYANPYYDKVALSLKFDGTNGSTSFVDTGPNAFAVTPYGNAQISTAQSKFGGAAGSFLNSGNYCSIANSPLFDFGSGDFSFEMWLYPTSLGAYRPIISKDTSTGRSWLIETNNSDVFFTIPNGTQVWIYGALTLNTWSHIYFGRRGSIMYSALNGQVSSVSYTATIPTTSTSVEIGRQGVYGGYFGGYIDELEITKGVAKYKANFTPPVRGLSTIYNPYTTLPVSGAALWLDGADSSTLFTDAGVTPVNKSGDLVYQWSDKSGNNRHATQATSGNRPTWVPPASGQNGFGVLSFNGSQYIKIPSPATWARSNPTTIFVVYNRPSGTTEACLLDVGNNRAITISNVIKYYRTNASSTGTLTLTGSHSIIIPDDGTAPVVYLDGTSNSITNPSFVNGTDNGIGIGSIAAGGSLYLVGSICEIAIYSSTLTSGQVATLNSYLKAKWGTP